jgi:methoxymalonate biosynthesis protein
MGTGIASMALGHGVAVTLVDVEESVLERARTGIAAQVRHGRLLGAFPEGLAEGELSTTVSVGDVIGATVVIEAIPEDTGLKAKVLGEASELVAAGTPLVSNTSGIPIDELANSVVRPGELVGTHFMNPTYLIPMVEVIRGPRTTDLTLTAVTGLWERLARRVVIVADAPGFVTSRLLHPMINDAARVVAAGTASAEAVDELMQGCLGHATGPLRTADLIGLDNLVDALQLLAEHTGIEHYRPCKVLVSMVQAGNLGRKSGRGFYDYGKAPL